jgi:hypothetical protein
VSSAALASSHVYQSVLEGQVLFYAAALLGFTQRRSGRRSFVFSVPCAICLLSWATIVGFLRYFTNRQQVTWERVVTPGVSSNAA